MESRLLRLFIASMVLIPQVGIAQQMSRQSLYGGLGALLGRMATTSADDFDGSDRRSSRGGIGLRVRGGGLWTIFDSNQASDVVTRLRVGSEAGFRYHPSSTYSRKDSGVEFRTTITGFSADLLAAISAETPWQFGVYTKFGLALGSQHMELETVENESSNGEGRRHYRLMPEFIVGMYYPLDDGVELTAEFTGLIGADYTRSLSLDNDVASAQFVSVGFNYSI